MRHITMWGSDGYPVRKLGSGRWIWDEFYGVKGAPIVYRTKREAVAAFERFHELLLERLGAEAKARHQQTT